MNNFPIYNIHWRSIYLQHISDALNNQKTFWFEGNWKPIPSHIQTALKKLNSFDLKNAADQKTNPHPQLKSTIEVDRAIIAAAETVIKDKHMFDPVIFDVIKGLVGSRIDLNARKDDWGYIFNLLSTFKAFFPKWQILVSSNGQEQCLLFLDNIIRQMTTVYRFRPIVDPVALQWVPLQSKGQPHLEILQYPLSYGLFFSLLKTDTDHLIPEDYRIDESQSGSVIPVSNTPVEVLEKLAALLEKHGSNHIRLPSDIEEEQIIGQMQTLPTSISKLASSRDNIHTVLTIAAFNKGNVVTPLNAGNMLGISNIHEVYPEHRSPQHMHLLPPPPHDKSQAKHRYWRTRTRLQPLFGCRFVREV